ncbi:hypothetical protein EV426DRAFT_617184 [Tirmania nivea]|nr:hypothetical protein EV426DRAFT_617184 [Tirmania nivea]
MVSQKQISRYITAHMLYFTLCTHYWASIPCTVSLSDWTSMLKGFLHANPRSRNKGLSIPLSLLCFSCFGMVTCKYV